jgi:hypothetical protein
VGKADGKSPRGRPTRRWDNNIKTDLQEVESEAWIGLIWLRLGTSSGP